MIANATRVIRDDAVEYFDHGPDLNLQTGFFPHLASDALFQGFTELQGPPRQTPLPGQGFVPAIDEHYLPVLHDDGSDSDDRTLGVLPSVLASVVHPSAFSVLSSCSVSVRGSGFGVRGSGFRVRFVIRP